MTDAEKIADLARIARNLWAPKQADKLLALSKQMEKLQ